jgi:hypothetical protein
MLTVENVFSTLKFGVKGLAEPGILIESNIMLV